MPVNTPSSRHVGTRFGFPDLGRFWTIANMLTLSRIVVIPPLAWLGYHGGPQSWLLVLVGFVVLTDYLDGRVARLTNTVTEWGKVLDPIADKLAAAVMCTVLAFREVEPQLAVWFLILVVVRDIVITIGGVIVTRKLGFVLMALMSGKIAVNLLVVTILAVLFNAEAWIVQVLMWTTTVFLLYSLIRYLLRFKAVAHYGTDVELDERHNLVRSR